MLVKLNSEITVNPTHVSHVQVHPHYNTVVVKMVSGEQFTLQSDYGRSVWETHDRIVKACNEVIMERLNAVAKENSPH